MALRGMHLVFEILVGKHCWLKVL